MKGIQGIRILDTDEGRSAHRHQAPPTSRFGRCLTWVFSRVTDFFFTGMKGIQGITILVADLKNADSNADSSEGRSADRSAIPFIPFIPVRIPFRDPRRPHSSAAKSKRHPTHLVGFPPFVREASLLIRWQKKVEDGELVNVYVMNELG